MAEHGILLKLEYRIIVIEVRTLRFNLRPTSWAATAASPTQFNRGITKEFFMQFERILSRKFYCCCCLLLLLCNFYNSQFHLRYEKRYLIRFYAASRFSLLTFYISSPITHTRNSIIHDELCFFALDGNHSTTLESVDLSSFWGSFIAYTSSSLFSYFSFESWMRLHNFHRNML